MNTKLRPREERIMRLLSEPRPFPPTVREIARGVGLSSTSTVQTYLNSLEDRGYIRRRADHARSIEVLRPVGTADFDAILRRLLIEHEGVTPGGTLAPPTDAPADWQSFGNYGWCSRCGASWADEKGHNTPFDGGHQACFPLCEECWSVLTPAERLPWYRRMLNVWNADVTIRAQVECAVLEGL